MSYSQSDIAKTTLYIELLGNGGAYSINIERSLLSNLNGRIGIGQWSTDDWGGAGERSIVTVPIMGNMFIGGGANKLEVGAGVLIGWSRFKSSFGEENDRKHGIFDLTGVIGYRYQKPEGGFVGRIGLTPFLALNGEEDAYPDPGLSLSGGVSFGYSF